MARSKFPFIVSIALPVFTACGGSEPPPQTPTSQYESRDDEEETGGIEAMAEIGGMPEEATVAAFKAAFGPIQRCFAEGVRRVEYLGGELAVQVRVGKQGKVLAAFAERSSLGDRKTERCMLQALEHVEWPAPVGGHVGIAQNSFEFEMTGDVRAPVLIDDFESGTALSDKREELQECKGSVRDTFTATVYIDTDGSALAAGIAAPHADAEAKSDCLVSVLEQVRYPSPGSWPGKVSFSL